MREDFLKKNEKENEMIEEKFKKLSKEEVSSVAKKQRKFTLGVYLTLAIGLACFILPFCIASIVNKSLDLIGVIIVAGIFDIISIVMFFINKNKDDNYFCKQSLTADVEKELKEASRKTFDTIENDLYKMDFYASKQICSSDRKMEGIYTTLFLDNINKKILILSEEYKWAKLKNRKYSKIFNYSDLIKYEVFENGSQVVSGTSGKALIGGAFFGLGGAIIGASGKRTINNICNELKLLLYIKDFECSFYSIDFLMNYHNCQKNTNIYRASIAKLQEWCSILELMFNDSNN